MAQDMYSAIQAATDATNQFNAEQAQISRDWQEYMSNTAHQREMADLAAAGLNPILSARQGASTPSGATATGESSAGALSGLFSQVLATQSAQAIADRNNAAAKLLEEMRESHDLYIHQNYPSNAYQAVSAVLHFLAGGEENAFVNAGSALKLAGDQAANWYRNTKRKAPYIRNGIPYGGFDTTIGKF